MGQQQLLLLVLGIVIVGLAVVVGIQAFGENQRRANQDAMINDAIRIASDAQAWALKPVAFGGNAGRQGVTTFDGLTFQRLGYTVDNVPEYSNINGTYTLPGTPGADFTIRGESATDATSLIWVRVCGLDHRDIVTQVGGTTAPDCPTP